MRLCFAFGLAPRVPGLALASRDMLPSPDKPPPDGHVHSEWSWDAPGGSMQRTCARAVDIGLACIAFTEHADFTPWTLGASRLPPGARAEVTPEGVVVPPVFDVNGYLECLQRCRDLYPGLRILSGVELSEPHWHARRTAQVLELGGFDRVLGSVHSLPAGGRYLEVGTSYQERTAGQVVRGYLAEVTRMVTASDAFAVLAHIDYPVRYWPADAGRHDPRTFEAEYREVLRALAGTSRALEVNTRVPLHPLIVRWRMASPPRRPWSGPTGSGPAVTPSICGCMPSRGRCRWLSDLPARE
jgi:histidinol-phosphatase (PHP family)